MASSYDIEPGKASSLPISLGSSHGNKVEFCSFLPIRLMWLVSILGLSCVNLCEEFLVVGVKFLPYTGKVKVLTVCHYSCQKG